MSEYHEMHFTFLIEGILGQCIINAQFFLNHRFYLLYILTITTDQFHSDDEQFVFSIVL